MTNPTTGRPNHVTNRSVLRSLPAISVIAAVAVIAGAEASAWAQSTPVLNERVKLLAPDAASNDALGASVAIDGATVVVGVQGDDDNGLDSGSAHIYVRDANGVWSQQFKLIAPDGAVGDSFGACVAISGDTAVVGAFHDDDNGFDSGSAYVFVRDASGAWSQQAKLLASDGTPADEFGTSASLSGDTTVVGAPLAFGSVGGGAAYVFVRDSLGS